MDGLFPAHPDIVVKNSTALATLDNRNFLQKMVGVKAPTPEQTPAKFQRKDFVIETGPKNEGQVEFNDSVQQEYKTFLNNRLGELVQLYNDEPNSPMFSGRLEFNRHILEDLVPKDDLGRYRFTPEVASTIADRLKNDAELWKYTTQALEYDISMTSFALALEAQMDPHAFSLLKTDAARLSDPQQVSFDIDKHGAGRVVANSAILGGAVAGISGLAATVYNRWPSMPDVIHRLGDIAVQIGSTVAQNPDTSTAVVGGVILAGGALARVVQDITQKRITFDLTRNSEALLALKKPEFAQEADFLRKILKIDIDDYAVNADGSIRKTGRRLQGSASIKEMEEQFVEKMITRASFMHQGLGIPMDSIRAVPENHVFSGPVVSDENYEPILTTWRHQEQQLYHKLLASGGYSEGTIEERMRLAFEAKGQSINKRLEVRLTERKLRVKDQATINALQKKKDARSNGEGKGERIKELTAGLESVRKALEDVNAKLTPEQTDLETYQAAFDKVSKIRQQIKDAIGTDDLSKLDDEISERERIGDLTQLRSDLDTALKELDRHKEKGNDIDHLIARSRGDLNSLVGKAGIDAKLAKAGLSKVDLSLTTARTSIREVLKKINDAYELGQKATPPVVIGWPVSANADPSNRLTVMLAMTEARSINANAAVKSPSTELTDWSKHLTENLIRRSSINELITAINTKSPPLTALNASNPTDRALALKVLDEARSRFATHANMLKAVIDEEPETIKQYNSNAASEKAELTRLVAKDTTDVESMRTEEDAVNKWRVPSKVAEYSVNHLLDKFEDAYMEIDDWHNKLIVNSAYTDTIDPATLHTLSLQEFVNRIHKANAADPFRGWPPAQDTFNLNVRTAIFGLAEAQARNEHPTTPNLTKILGYPALSESKMVSTKADELFKYLNQRGAGLKINDVEEAIDLAKKRLAVRQRSILKNLSDAKTFSLLSGADCDVAIYELNPEYTEADKKLTDHKVRLGVSGSKDIQTVIDERNAKINALKPLEPSQNVQNLKTLITDYATSYENYLTKRTAVEGLLPGVQNVSEIDEHIKQRATHKTEDLIQLRKDLQAQYDLIKESADATEKVKELHKKMNSDLVEIDGIDGQLAVQGLTTVNLKAADIRNLTYEEILRRANEANRLGSTKVPPVVIAWPASDNNKPETQLKIMHAIAQARGEEKVGTYFPTLSATAQADFMAWTAGTGLSRAFTLYELAGKSPQNLTTEINASRIGGTPPITEDQVRAVIEASQGILQRVQEAHKQTIEANAKRLPILEEDKKKLASGETIKQEMAVVNTLLDIHENIGKRYGRITEFIREMANNADFENPNTTPPQAVRDAFTKAGYTTTLYPHGYYEIVQFLHNPEGDPAKTIDFLVTTNQFRPDRIAVLLNKHFNLGLDPTTPPILTIENAVKHFKDGRIDSPHVFRGFNAIIRELTQEVASWKN